MPTSPPDWLPAGYRLVARLGAGAVGEVWDAEVGDQRVALKVLRTAGGDDPATERECRLLGGLSHPNIVRFLGLHPSEAGVAVLEMERVDGTSLAAMAAEHGGFLAWDGLKPLALQLCAALAHAHDQEVVHRDIKPSNLLVDSSGTLKVVDFGCAAITRRAGLDLTGTVELASKGTLPFMSPQQVNGVAADPSDDVYAVGATLHTLLVGTPPFHQGYVVHQVLHEAAPTIPIHQRRLGIPNPVPPGVARIIAACLSKDPARRPANAVQLGTLLEREAPATSGRRKALLTLGTCGLGIAVGIPALLRQRRWSPGPAPEPGFEPIFDGATLTGWKGEPGVWDVKDGAIVGRLEAPRMPDASNWHRELLDWTGPVPDDFELRLEVMLTLGEPDAGNLGIRYRIPPDRPALAYELDFEPIWKFNCGLREINGRDMLARPSQIVHYQSTADGAAGEADRRLVGHLVNEKVLQRVYRDRGWNQLAIRAKGDRLVHELNGVALVDFTDADPMARRLSGGLGLKMMLYYGPSVEARFRHIRLRAL